MVVGGSKVEERARRAQSATSSSFLCHIRTHNQATPETDFVAWHARDVVKHRIDEREYGEESDGLDCSTKTEERNLSYRERCF